MDKKSRVLNIEPDGYSAEAKAILESFAIVDERRLNRDELISEIHKYDVLITRLGYDIDQTIIKEGSRLKAIATATTGLDHIDASAAKRSGIKIISLQGEKEFLEGITATAEHTFALILALCRKIPFAFDSVRTGEWDRDKFRGIQLQGKTLGIIGYGRLGRMVANYGICFRMNVLLHDPHVHVSDTNVRQVSREELFSSADIVTLHVPLTNETEGLIGKKEILSLKKGAFLINTSRGKLIDEIALIEALESEHLGGVAIDVISDELMPNNKFSEHPLVRYAQNHTNLIITPHIGGATLESMRDTEVFIAKKIKTFFLRRKP
jgi:D-3-phosphoglycerate dehydrogenase